jgi:uncharacterized membrane protein
MSNSRKKLPNNKYHEQSSLTYSRTQQLSISPLPPAEEMEKYKNVDPEIPKTIIKQWEKQTDHRQDLEKSVINNDILISRMGLLFAFLIGISGIVGGVVIALSGHEVAGSIFSGVSLVSLVSTFIYGTNKKNKQIEKKKEN